LIESSLELEAVENKISDKETFSLKNKSEKLTADIKTQKEKIEEFEAEKAKVVEVLETYYENDKLKAEYSERTDTDLISHFKNGVLSRYNSDDIVLRTVELKTILDSIRKEVIWE
jgi:type I restriction enzyme M protein